MQTLGAYASNIDYGLSVASTSAPVGPRLLRITDIENAFVNWAFVPFCDVDEREAYKYRLAHDDVVVARTGASTGRSLWISQPEHAVFASYLVRFRFPESICARYIGYVLQGSQWKHHVDSIAGAKSAQPNMSASAMAEFPLELPPLPEQQAIAEVLGALDDKIAANRVLAETLAEASQTLFAFVRRSSELTQPLAEVVETQYGLTTSAADYGDHRLLRVTDINKHPWIEWQGTPYASGVSPSDATKYKLTPGDVVVARMADPGKVAILEEGDPASVFASYLIRARPKDPQTLPPLYLFHFMRSAEYQEYASSNSSGSVQRNMNAKVIVGTDIPLAPSRTLTRFTQAVAPLHRQMAAVLRESSTLASLRDTLLPALMDGTIRVKDASAAVSEAV